MISIIFCTPARSIKLDETIWKCSCKKKKEVVNVKNIDKDNRCFEWAILSGLVPLRHGQHPDRPTKYQEYLGILDFNKLNFL